MSGDSRWDDAKEVLSGGLLSVILPVYRLGDRIEGNLVCVEKCLDGTGFHYELVPVDDGSDDGTGDALRRAAAARPDVVHPVFLKENSGKGNALKSGFRASAGEFVLLLDGDMDITLRTLPDFFSTMRRTRSDIVIGSKRHPESSVVYP